MTYFVSYVNRISEGHNEFGFICIDWDKPLSTGADLLEIREWIDMELRRADFLSRNVVLISIQRMPL